MLRVILLSLSLSVSSQVFSAYDANILGKITHVLTYADGDYILFRLDSQPASHPACQSDYFAIDGTLPDGRRQQMLSRLLLSFAKSEEINIGYDSQGDCVSGHIRVHRVG